MVAIDKRRRWTRADTVVVVLACVPLAYWLYDGLATRLHDRSKGAYTEKVQRFIEASVFRQEKLQQVLKRIDMADDGGARVEVEQLAAACRDERSALIRMTPEASALHALHEQIVHSWQLRCEGLALWLNEDGDVDAVNYVLMVDRLSEAGRLENQYVMRLREGN